VEVVLASAWSFGGNPWGICNPVRMAVENVWFRLLVSKFCLVLANPVRKFGGHLKEKVLERYDLGIN